MFFYLQMPKVFAVLVMAKVMPTNQFFWIMLGA